MFIGHFGVALAAKKLAPKTNLVILFIACQLLDLIWPILVLVGIEQVSVDHSATVVNPLNFIHYPFSHSLVMSLIYSLVGSLIGWKFYKSYHYGIIIGLVIFSHWVLDLITHRPDLPIFFGEPKLGLGLWNSLVGTLLVEVGIFIIGIFLYLKSTAFKNKKQKIIFWSLIGFLSVIYLGNIFGPKAPVGTPSAAIAGPALAMWLIVLWAYFADRSVESN